MSEKIILLQNVSGKFYITHRSINHPETNPEMVLVAPNWPRFPRVRV